MVSLFARCKLYPLTVHKQNLFAETVGLIQKSCIILAVVSGKILMQLLNTMITRPAILIGVGSKK